MFFRAVVEAGYYDDEYFYEYDAASSTTDLAVSIDEGFSPFGHNWFLRIDEYGEDGTYYHTLIDLENGTSKDTWSYSKL